MKANLKRFLNLTKSWLDLHVYHCWIVKQKHSKTKQSKTAQSVKQFKVSVEEAEGMCHYHVMPPFLFDFPLSLSCPSSTDILACEVPQRRVGFRKGICLLLSRFSAWGSECPALEEPTHLLAI